MKKLFQSTRSVRSATGTFTGIVTAQSNTFQSTRSVRSATDYKNLQGLGYNISIHALRAERDLGPSRMAAPVGGFQSTRSVRSATKTSCRQRWTDTLFQSTRSVRSATSMMSIVASRELFQSTRSVRSATQRRVLRLPRPTHFNPRAPCGARLKVGGVWRKS